MPDNLDKIYFMKSGESNTRGEIYDNPALSGACLKPAQKMMQMEDTRTSHDTDLILEVQRSIQASEGSAHNSSRKYIPTSSTT
ncbi:hypothetical protein [Dialister sp.]|uniref:hypothetical protein n=1 Tax=Dialister sp. TaxID=1955814 RepID=UPI003F101392